MLPLLNIDYSSLMGTLPLNSGSSDSLNSFINNGFLGLITEADTTYKIVGSVIALVFALLGCFFGYEYYRFHHRTLYRSDSCLPTSSCRRFCIRSLHYSWRCGHCSSCPVDLPDRNFHPVFYLCI